jgi:transposase-like protein
MATDYKRLRGRSDPDPAILSGRTLARERYEHGSRDGKHRNGRYDRIFCLKGIGEVTIKVPRDRHGEIQTEVVPRSQRYETAIADDFALMYLTCSYMVKLFKITESN